MPAMEPTTSAKQSVRHRIAGLDYTHATEVDGKDVECSVGTALDCR